MPKSEECRLRVGMPFNEQAAYRSTAMQSRNISPRVNHPMIAISPAMDNGAIGRMLRRFDQINRLRRKAILQEYAGLMPSVAKRRNIASIRWGGSLAPPSSHQVITAMNAPTTY